MNRSETVARFRALHVPGDPLVMPNPWDLGSARVMVAAGAKALATTSSGFAFTLGLPDGGRLTRDQALEHAAAIAALGLPVNGDFEDGYGETPADVAETVRLAAEAGLAGVSVEDTDLAGNASFDFATALARVEAAIDAARSADIVLTARADGFLRRAYDEEEAIRRCRAFADAGAEVIYAPFVSPDATRALAAIAPVNVLAAGPMLEHSVAAIAAMGAARISVGGSLARVTHRAVIDGVRALLDDGAFTGLRGGAPASEVDALLDAGS